MGINGWFERFKRQRNEKKKEKLRQQFSFLIEEYKTCQEDSVREMLKKQEDIMSSNILNLEQKTRDLFCEIDNTFKMRINEMRNDLHVNKSEISVLIDEISRKIEDIDAENLKNYEDTRNTFDKIVSSFERKLSKSTKEINNTFDTGCSKIQAVISQSQNELNSDYRDIKTVLQNIGTQLELIQKNVREVTDSTKTIIDDKATGIILSIDEVKTLIKVVAVNNLLEEIEYKPQK